MITCLNLLVGRALSSCWTISLACWIKSLACLVCGLLSNFYCFQLLKPITQPIRQNACFFMCFLIVVKTSFPDTSLICALHFELVYEILCSSIVLDYWVITRTYLNRACFLLLTDCKRLVDGVYAFQTECVAAWIQPHWPQHQLTALRAFQVFRVLLRNEFECLFL